MKRNNKSWIRQLSESYIRQALNENEDMHAIIAARHRDLPGTDDADAQEIKRILDAHAAEHGPFADEADAAEHIVGRYSNLTPTNNEGRIYTANQWYNSLLGYSRGAHPGSSNDSSSDTYTG